MQAYYRRARNFSVCRFYFHFIFCLPFSLWCVFIFIHFFLSVLTSLSQLHVKHFKALLVFPLLGRFSGSAMHIRNVVHHGVGGLKYLSCVCVHMFCIYEIFILNLFGRGITTSRLQVSCMQKMKTEKRALTHNRARVRHG